MSALLAPDPVIGEREVQWLRGLLVIAKMCQVEDRSLSLKHKTQEARVTGKYFALGKRSKESRERDVETGTGTMLTKVRPKDAKDVTNINDNLMYNYLLF